MTLTCTQDMLLTASQAGRELTEQSLAGIGDFFTSQQLSCGGFAGRDGQSDLYYTLFGIAGMLAAGRTPDTDRLEAYLNTFRSTDHLDFVHRVTLLRCLSSIRYAALAPEFIIRAAVGSDLISRLLTRAASIVPPGEAARKALTDIEKYRTTDGGYHHASQGAPKGTAYAAFLAHLAYQDTMIPMPFPEKLKESLLTMKQNDGSYANADDLDSGSTTATAAAIVLLCELGIPVEETTTDMLIDRLQPEGGFRANSSAPAPDLLSTSTALYALKRAEISLDADRDRILDFVSSLWNNDGGFSGTLLDEKSDCEYSFYALLALGSLAA